MTPHAHNTQDSQPLQFRRWFCLRIVAPTVIAGFVFRATRGDGYFDILGPLVWTLFATHLAATFAFAGTHLLDTGAFFCLIFASGAAANISERAQMQSPLAWGVVAIAFVVYALLSLIGRYRAAGTPPTRSVSIQQVVAAFSVLFVALMLCGTSKTAVGFLFVPGLLIIPFILFWSLVSPRRRVDQPDNKAMHGNGDAAAN